MSHHRKTKDRAEAGADFERASKEFRPTLAAEFLYFLKHSKKWWLLPILVILGVLALLALFSATGIAPFIYPL
jgi:hypothetical protein